MTGRRIGAALLAGAMVLAALVPASARGPDVNYGLFCLGCHTSEGVSPPLGRIPPLKGAVGHLTLLPEGRRYIVNVPGVLNSGLGAEDTAALLNWMVATYGEASTPADFTPFTGAEVDRWRAAAPDDVMVLRAVVRDLLAARGISLDPYP
jgi:hypothetical protein